MKIIENCPQTEIFANSEVNKINELLANHARYKEHDEKIYLIINNEIELLRPSPKDKELANGFGIVEHNYLLSGKPIHLIMLNKEIIEECSLERDEKIAVILHELGHIFNPAVYKKNISYKDYGIDTIEKLHAKKKELDEVNGIITQENSMNSEFYADYFAKQCDYGEHLIVSMEKYLKYPTAINKEMMLKRIYKLREDVVLDGTMVIN